MIKVRCKCGRGMKVKDSAAGRRLKCPECGKAVLVPEPEDDYGDEYEDGDEDDYSPPPPKRRSSGGARKGSGKAKGKKKSKSGDGLPMPVMVGIVAVFAVVVIGGAIFAVYEPDPAAGGGDVAQNEVDDPAGIGTTEPEPPADPWANVAAGDLWVVITNLRIVPGSLGTKIVVEYRVAQGRPEPGKRYVLSVANESVGLGEKVVDFDKFELSPGGFLQFETDPNFANRTDRTVRAWMEARVGLSNGEKVSGDARIGQSSAESPTASDTAAVPSDSSAGGGGTAVTLSNARITKGNFGRNGLSVDMQLTGELVRARRYFLTIQSPASPSGWEVDVTTTLRTATGAAKTVSVGLTGVASQRELTVAVEKRGLGIIQRPGEEPEVVSNELTVN